ncbi:phage gp6-like head-tail connector protein [Paracoccus yeei]|uniref:Phage gp6-like head-tail connector protein n=1 Tax=Paracoccus yeei TaxID=147645 RepID=A0A1V0GVI7_9RHOB|nr:head-tail connector protein [Paracoccus yeei]ARC37893.1 phage gp6-like head-tail connector protein [Paracoccus yeei]
MAVLASLQEVRSALRIDSDDYDPTLALLIEAASGAVINYLKSSADQYLGPDGEVLPDVVIPPTIKAATIFLVGHMMRNPDNDTEKAFTHGFLPYPVMSMLYPLRDPALA